MITISFLQLSDLLVYDCPQSIFPGNAFDHTLWSKNSKIFELKVALMRGFFGTKGHWFEYIVCFALKEYIGHWDLKNSLSELDECIFSRFFCFEIKFCPEISCNFAWRLNNKYLVVSQWRLENSNGETERTQELRKLKDLKFVYRIFAQLGTL